MGARARCAAAGQPRLRPSGLAPGPSCTAHLQAVPASPGPASPSALVRSMKFPTEARLARPCPLRPPPGAASAARKAPSLSRMRRCSVTSDLSAVYRGCAALVVMVVCMGVGAWGVHVARPTPLCRPFANGDGDNKMLGMGNMCKTRRRQSKTVELGTYGFSLQSGPILGMH